MSPTGTHEQSPRRSLSMIFWSLNVDSAEIHWRFSKFACWNEDNLMKS